MVTLSGLEGAIEETKHLKTIYCIECYTILPPGSVENGKGSPKGTEYSIGR